ncbi:hypothetical protein CCP1ISM_5370001 [Azospirillaceae bacterium]
MEKLQPQLTLIGNFHTHPYSSLEEVNKVSGWDFSPGDENFMGSVDEFWNSSGNMPVMVVLTICRIQRVHEYYGAKLVRNNLWEFNIGQFRFWINVIVGYINNEGKRSNTGNTRSNVYLDLDSKFYNLSGARLPD